MKMDPVTFNIVSNGLISVAAEMGTVMLTSAYSTIVREAKDAATCVFDPEGRMAAQSAMLPMAMNSLPAAFAHFREIFDLASVRPGEAFITNDPYSMGQHLNDILLFLPVFFDDKPSGFVGIFSHHVDIGGSAPASSNADATELFQEGLILPPMKIEVAKDLGGGLIDQILGANVRAPSPVLGDFHAQLFSALRGERLLKSLMAKYGRDVVLACMKEAQDHAERVIRSNLAELPDGEYIGDDYIDGLREGDAPTLVRVRVRVDGDQAVVDLSESADQVNGPINSPLASTQSAVYTFFVIMLGGQAPANDGSYRPVRIVTRKGSICDPVFPAPVRSRSVTCYRILTALKRAFGGVVPHLVAAAGDDSVNSVMMGHRDEDGYHVYHESVGGGNGATTQCDGVDGVSQCLSNCANTPVESTEVECGFVRVSSYGLVPDSGGSGRFRGGRGIEKRYEILADGVTLCTCGDRHDSRPWGLEGGGEGSLSRYAILRDGESIELKPVSTVTTRKGDIILIRTSGGGGYGDPRERLPDRNHKDLAEGAITPERAKAIYGMDP